MTKEIDEELLRSLNFTWSGSGGFYRKFDRDRVVFDVDPNEFDIEWTNIRSYYSNSNLLTLAIL